MRSLLLAAVSVLAMWGADANAASIPTSWPFGSVFNAVVPQSAAKSNCSLKPGQSFFAYSPAGSSRIIGIPELFFGETNGGAELYYGGLSSLTFSSATAGTLVFDSPPYVADGKPPTPTLGFTGYAETYSATNATLKITMTLTINAAAGGPCTLKFEGFYRQS
jgi:hypothetical protein